MHDFAQPELDDNLGRSIPLKNEELLAPFKAYAVVPLEPSKRYGVVQLTIEKNKVISIRAFGHLETEKQAAEETFQKILRWEERMIL